MPLADVTEFSTLQFIISVIGNTVSSLNKSHSKHFINKHEKA
jgi:hypothetical protein